ncbi:hypothetical protein [Pseudomonas sp.]|uniref:hypothetical protein n=1 Tax=Pseudomonas sp. TaxID=306 RepID=UPI00258AD210|nr:hypothetical protein [Pseudomonas sp.]
MTDNYEMELPVSSLPVTGELGRLLVEVWLRKNIKWEEEDAARCISDEDKSNNAADLFALRRTLEYLLKD